MMPMQAASHAAWVKHWLYDWNGANVGLFMRINGGVPDQFVWLPRFLSVIGSYFAAPLVMLAMIASAWLVPVVSRRSAMSVALRFAVGVLLALGVGALAKTAFALPRPSLALGDHLVRVVGAVDSLYSFPSGHAVYVAVLATVLWPLAKWPGRVTLLALVAAVGWSRVALGAHFPADVLGGYAIGLACATIASSASQLAFPPGAR